MAWHGMTENCVCLRGGREEERGEDKGTLLTNLLTSLSLLEPALLEVVVMWWWWWWCTMMMNREGGALCTLTKKIDFTC